MNTLSTYVNALVDGVRWKAWGLRLDLPPEPVSLSTLRGIWGAALHDLDVSVYTEVFEGRGEGDMQRPLYVLRTAAGGAGLECIYMGAALEHEATLTHAWDIAGGRGIGKRRDPFLVRQHFLLASGPEYTMQSRWPENQPCRIAFLSPLRLLRKGALIASPTLHDMASAALRRIRDLQEQEPGLPWREVMALLSACCDDIPVLYEPVERKRVTRYSARQERDVELRCVMGAIILPEGPRALAPLLNVAQWLHVGKGTTIGMGQIELQQLRKPE